MKVSTEKYMWKYKNSHFIHNLNIENPSIDIKVCKDVSEVVGSRWSFSCWIATPRVDDKGA